jgi:hypothetical protein
MSPQVRLCPRHHRFVWADDGSVQCDCVVAFEKLGSLLSNRLNVGDTRLRHDDPLPEPLARLYRLDQSLWERALRAPGLCYQPSPRPPFGGAGPEPS